MRSAGHIGSADQDHDKVPTRFRHRGLIHEHCFNPGRSESAHRCAMSSRWSSKPTGYSNMGPEDLSIAERVPVCVETVPGHISGNRYFEPVYNYVPSP